MRRMRWVLLCLVPILILGGTVQGGEQPVRLFDKEYDFWSCDWSPDGRYLALAGKTHSQPADKTRIWLSRNGSDKPILLTNTDYLSDDWPRWSPDGAYIAMSRKDLNNRRVCVWMKNIQTGVGYRLTKGPDDRQPSWSPDGRMLDFRRGLGTDRSSLVTIDVVKGTVTVLPLADGMFGEPFWGADGNIYYTRYQSIQRESKAGNKTYYVPETGGRLCWFNPSAGQGGQVLTEDFDQRMPVLSPDGQWLAFYGRRDQLGTSPSIPDPEQWALFVRGQITQNCTELLSNVALTGGAPSWSRDGKTIIIYSLRRIAPALWSYAIGEEPGK